MNEHELIFRELTSPGSGAIRVLQLRGRGALDALRALSGREVWEPGALRLSHLRAAGNAAVAPGEVLDEALCHVVSDTCIELHVHGSEPVVRKLRELCQNQLGAALDAGGGLSKASIEERASALVAKAPSEAGARLLLDQAQGALRTELERLVKGEPAELSRGLAALAEAGRVARFALRSTPVVLAGPVNAGKSTLFNLLVRREDRALTSSVPGTTRDALSEPAFFGGWPIQLFDTAGTRDLEGRAPEETIEREGQALATRLRDRAELVFVLQPAGAEEPPPVAEAKTRVLHSQADRVPGPLGEASISVHAAPEAAAALCRDLFLEAFRLPAASWSAATAAPFDEASRETIERALGELETSQGGLDSRIERARAVLVASL